jgi:hypothetical protein
MNSERPCQVWAGGPPGLALSLPIQVALNELKGRAIRQRGFSQRNYKATATHAEKGRAGSRNTSFVSTRFV